MTNIELYGLHVAPRVREFLAWSQVGSERCPRRPGHPPARPLSSPALLLGDRPLVVLAVLGPSEPRCASPGDVRPRTCTNLAGDTDLASELLRCMPRREAISGVGDWVVQANALLWRRCHEVRHWLW